MISPKTKRNIYRIIPFGLMWLIFSIVYTLLERGILGHSNHYPSTGNPYNFRSAIYLTPISATLTGLFLGTLEVLYIHKWFRRLSFGKKIFFKSTIYLIIISLFLILVTAFSNYLARGTSLFSKQIWDAVWVFSLSIPFLSILVYIGAIIIVTQFYAEVSENVGLGVLRNFFTGKYLQPVEEERIFMFLDMKSSTTIAESMGHVRYFEMLKTYYADLSEPIIEYLGEVYQYVGDEIVVSWRLKNGLQNNNCIHCFLAMKAALHLQTDKYLKQYGLLPTFKAGFHMGKVTTGEIGVIKKDIIFTGDVLNTTARIQDLCNQYGVDNLVSNELIKQLQRPFPFQIKDLGETTLRGRGEKITLFSILSV
ncbi:adenylate/guanylate cyclase domain-containing protein [Flavisolibacter tropicus]|uniref:Adenylate cyclase n=1 Tax=Flavisolibacter tropicus TaxID=1492898 RepID=A0A172TSD2_9BACT|nr:adenylate/guanylate cyclase domain-containing protein [Flavisolibacter tropicus]ANE49697.1 adenylate cyclase [Flavisolibacter tropicus]